ncbi:MAG: NAD-dependent epimerase/dehydratase family protein [Bryobacterales bacterium]|nr:NAD-dependent epimerase/dehydratase family protein [Bryobacterales bacterium]
MRILVVGGTQFIGRHLVDALLAAGHRVTLLHRKTRRLFAGRIDDLLADRADETAVRRALKGRRFDAVFDNAYDWAHGTTAAQVGFLADACTHPGLKRYIFTSTVAVYGDGKQGCRETAPLVKAPNASPYALNKAESERLLFRLYKRSGFPAVTLRPPFVYGPYNNFYREQFFWDRLRLNRPILIPGNGRAAMQFVYVKDFARLALLALTHDGAPGHAFNVAHDAPLSQNDAVRLMAATAGATPTLVHVPRKRIAASGASAFAEPFYFAQYFDLPAITEDTSKARRRLGFTPTSMEQGFAETYRWYLRHHKPRTSGFEIEDQLMFPGASRS